MKVHELIAILSEYNPMAKVIGIWEEDVGHLRLREALDGHIIIEEGEGDDS